MEIYARTFLYCRREEGSEDKKILIFSSSSSLLLISTAPSYFVLASKRNNLMEDDLPTLYYNRTLTRIIYVFSLEAVAIQAANAR